MPWLETKFLFWLSGALKSILASSLFQGTQIFAGILFALEFN